MLFRSKRSFPALAVAPFRPSAPKCLRCRPSNTVPHGKSLRPLTVAHRNPVRISDAGRVRLPEPQATHASLRTRIKAARFPQPRFGDLADCATLILATPELHGAHTLTASGRPCSPCERPLGIYRSAGPIPSARSWLRTPRSGTPRSSRSDCRRDGRRGSA